MITVRNRDQALSFTAVAGAADLKAGMLVKFAQGTAAGEPPKVVRATAADIIDATVVKGIVDYNAPDSQEVDFVVDPATLALTPVAKLIPSGAVVNVWTNRPVIAYHSSLLDSTLAPATVREPAKVGFSETTSFPAAYDAGETNGLQHQSGLVYRVDAPEVTIAFTNL